MNLQEMNQRIPLLSRKPMKDFTPEEFKIYVRALFFKPVPKKAKAKKKLLRALKVTAKILKRGSISIKTKRTPKYLTEDEMKKLSLSMGRPENEIFLALVKEKIHLLSHEEAEKISSSIEEIPWKLD